MNIAAIVRDPRLLLNLVVVLLVTVMATAGLRPYLASEVGVVAGTAMAFAIALTIELSFSQHLRQWRSSGRLMNLSWAVVFGAVSMCFTVPPLFALFQGQQVSEAHFAEQRDFVVREVVTARDRLAMAAEAAAQVAATSDKLAAREEAKGDSCGKAAPGRGARYDFRVADAAMFRGLSRDVSASEHRLRSVADGLVATRLETGAARQAGLARMNMLVSQAYGIVHDPALAAAAARLEERAQTDQAERRGAGNETFKCGDPDIRERAQSTAQQLRSLPALRQRIDVPDMTEAGTVMAELPALLVRTIVGGHGLTLTPTAISAVVISLLLECMLVGTTMLVAFDPTIGARLRAAHDAMKAMPSSNVGLLVQALADPSSEMARLWVLLNRYRLNVWPWNIVVVAHGRAAPELCEVARVMSVLSAIGWARRFRPLPGLVLAVLCWWRWPEMRGAMYRECFRIDVTALDEVNLADALARADAKRPMANPSAFQADRRCPGAPGTDDLDRRPSEQRAVVVVD